MRDPATKPSKKNKVLTPRQVEILAWVAIGATDAEIAEKLGISSSTVKGHLNKIFKKINAPNRQQAILWALKYLQHSSTCIDERLKSKGSSKGSPSDFPLALKRSEQSKKRKPLI